MPGLVSVGHNRKQQAKQGLQSYTQMQNAREAKQDQLELAEDIEKKNTIGMATGMGAALAAGTGFGSSVLPAFAAGGPAGAAIGLGVGLLASELF